MTAAGLREPLMPTDITPDGMVCWHALRSIARVNDDYGGDSPHLIDADEVAGYCDDDWDHLAAETRLGTPITVGQRALIISTLHDLERDDLGQCDRWWQR